MRMPMRRAHVSRPVVAAYAVGGILAGILIAVPTRWIDADDLRTWAPVASSIIAAFALALSAYTYATSARRARQLQTYDAWMNWNDGTRSARRQISEKYPVMSANNAKILANSTLAPVLDSDAADDAHTIGTYLTGLERIATGWKSGIYDLDELDRLAATIIIRTEQRHSAYIRAVRVARRHPAAYTSLEDLADALRRRHPRLR